jgi:hypothetical protein
VCPTATVCQDRELCRRGSQCQTLRGRMMPCSRFQKEIRCRTAVTSSVCLRGRSPISRDEEDEIETR